MDEHNSCYLWYDFVLSWYDFFLNELEKETCFNMTPETLVRGSTSLGCHLNGDVVDM